MKSKKLTNRFFLAIIATSLVLFSSCASDSSSDNVMSVVNESTLAEIAETPFSLVLKAYDAEGADVTTQGDVEGANLFIFDSQNDFVKQVSVPKSALLNRQTIEISCPNTDKITVVAWGGLSSQEEVSSLSMANIISDLQIQLKQNNGIAQVPSDLFYGSVVLNRPATKSTAQQVELKLERKVSSLALSTKGLTKKFGTEGIYEYRVHASNDGFDYQGNLISDDVVYIFPASFDKSGNLVSDMQAIVPSSKMTIELYKDGELIFSVQNDKNGENLSAKTGKQMNYVFNYSAKTKAELVVTPWNTVVQYVTVG